MHTCYLQVTIISGYGQKNFYARYSPNYLNLLFYIKGAHHLKWLGRMLLLCHSTPVLTHTFKWTHSSSVIAPSEEVYANISNWSHEEITAIVSVHLLPFWLHQLLDQMCPYEFLAVEMWVVCDQQSFFFNAFSHCWLPREARYSKSVSED